MKEATEKELIDGLVEVLSILQKFGKMDRWRILKACLALIGMN